MLQKNTKTKTNVSACVSLLNEEEGGREIDDMSQLPELQQYAEAFRKATGLPFLKLVPPDDLKPFVCDEKEVNPLCYLVCNSESCGKYCLENQTSLLQRTTSGFKTQQHHCFIGLTVFAVPVMDGKRHVATLISGQVFLRNPTERDFEKMALMLGAGKGKQWLRKARKVYFETPVIPADRMQAIVQLLNDFSRYLPEEALRHSVAPLLSEHKAVSSAKQLIESSSDEPMTLSKVLSHVHVSRFHFCKIFKKTTGMTLTEYINQVRLAKAKKQLLDPSLRVAEIVFSSGFGSIAQFNNLFRRHMGMSPSEYRRCQWEKSQGRQNRLESSAIPRRVPVPGSFHEIRCDHGGKRAVSGQFFPALS